jgi:hypothetical protein
LSQLSLDIPVQERIGIIGSRNYKRLDFVASIVQLLGALIPRPIIVSGGAEGVDTIAEESAIAFGLERKIFLPEDSPGKTFSERALHRNSLIVKYSTRLIAFWSGDDWRRSGTANTIRRAWAADKPIWIYGPTGDAIDSDYLKRMDTLYYGRT